MHTCFQFQSMSVLDHGRSVHNWFKDLHAHLKHGSPLQRQWRLPEWIYDPLLMEKLFDFELLETYQVYHDCGKPLCRTVDDQGRQHFPDHAQVSARRWAECSDGSPEALRIGRLIAMDMDAHTIKAEGIAEFAAREEAASLLVTALCEIHSNADMFGGIDSTSFKIKWKALEKTGKRVLSCWRTQG